SQLLYGTVFTNYFAGPQKTPKSQAEEIIDIVFRGILSDSERASFDAGRTDVNGPEPVPQTA
ncbi:MAG TPA: hypothetical protein VGH33_04360, partial [Isosphaeraceae bacterium]